MAKTVGILALQGCVEPHKAHLEACGVAHKEVRNIQDMDGVDGYILPGGESSTMLKLINIFGLYNRLADEFSKKPVWGICAGAILMAKTVTDPAQDSFGILDMTVRRNGYGRQVNSFETEVQNYPVSFIRAPMITDTGSAQVVAEEGCAPVWVTNGRHMATTFHPELTEDYPSPMHKKFCEMIEE